MNELLRRKIQRLRDITWGEDIARSTVPEYIEHHESIQRILKYIDDELLSIPVEESKGIELAAPLQQYNIVVNDLTYSFIPGSPFIEDAVKSQRNTAATQVKINDNLAWLMMDAAQLYSSQEQFESTCQKYLQARGLLSTAIPEECAGCASLKAMCMLEEKKCPPGYPPK